MVWRRFMKKLTLVLAGLPGLGPIYEDCYWLGMLRTMDWKGSQWRECSVTFL